MLKMILSSFDDTEVRNFMQRKAKEYVESSTSQANS